MSFRPSLESEQVLVSDLDGTLLGDDRQLERFAAWRRRHGRSLRLVYASGRFYDSIVESIRTTALPAPEAVIAGVGTDIRTYPDGEPLASWQAEFHRFDAGEVRGVMARYGELTLQPEHLQSDFKVSYFGHELSDELIESLWFDLAAADLDAQIVYSSSRDLDVLPATADKGAAARFLTRLWDVPPRRVLASGDSGNDRSMLAGDFRGIVVANCQEELKPLGGPSVYHSPYPYAAGVLDGIEHWMRRRAESVVPARQAASLLLP